MRNSDKLKRAVAFYTSVLLFFGILPILLSYSLGYRIDYRAMKVYKTGIIFINSKPSGASIYINDKLFDTLTPAQIENLAPGSYKARVKREGFYPWEEELVVRPNMVTKADSIILFPVMQELNKIIDQPITDFTVSDKGYVYYFAEFGLYRSDNDGSNIKKLSTYSGWPKKMIKKRFSPEGDKILCYNEKEIVVVYLNIDKDEARNGQSARVENILTAEEPIVDVFWYTGSGYIIVVTEKYINVVELRGGGKRNIATLYKFNTEPHAVVYDSNNGSLYFMDRVKVNFSRDGGYLYRLDLRQKFFDYLMQLLLKRDIEVPGGKK
ncbi:MAG: PEGA domain-containing protein [Candidatus Omnitrophota bacterium]|nr:PEGA domain-containing protein [Candidatus Omnitrophota bacterium]